VTVETKVTDLTINELREIIREIIAEYLEPDGELRPEIIADLRERIRTGEWVDHDSVWDDE